MSKASEYGALWAAVDDAHESVRVAASKAQMATQPIFKERFAVVTASGGLSISGGCTADVVPELVAWLIDTFDVKE